MKNVKLVWVLFLGLATTVISCNQADVSADDYDSSLMEFVSYATNGDSTSTSGHKHKSGKKLTQIEISALPTVVTTYITTTYAGSTIKHAGKSDSTGNYYVHIVKSDSTHLGLKFDAAGVFISVVAKKAKGTHIAVASLPTSITTYISTTYVGSTVKHAMLDSDGSYKIIVEKADATKIGLGFSSAGVFTAEIAIKTSGKVKRRKG
jgi:hypothetical protein